MSFLPVNTPVAAPEAAPTPVLITPPLSARSVRLLPQAVRDKATLEMSTITHNMALAPSTSNPITGCQAGAWEPAGHLHLAV